MKWLLNKCSDTREKGMADFHLISLAINHGSFLACSLEYCWGHREALSAARGDKTLGICIVSMTFFRFFLKIILLKCS